MKEYLGLLILTNLLTTVILVCALFDKNKKIKELLEHNHKLIDIIANKRR